jgi:hypothetical protein
MRANLQKTRDCMAVAQGLMCRVTCKGVLPLAGYD